MNREFEVTDSVVKYSNPWMKVIELKTLTDGKPGIYGVVERSDSATIIVESKNQEILFVKQYRYPTHSYSWELPMGGIDQNEKPLAGAIRELEEETGCKVNLEKIGEFKPVPGLTPQTAYVYYGKIDDDNKVLVNTYNEVTDEITERVFLSKEDIKRMIASHEISDGFTLCSLAIYSWR